MEPFMIHALALTAARPDRRLTGDAEILGALAAPEPAWLHLKADDPGAVRWMTDQLAFLDPFVPAALVAEETRPRVKGVNDGLLVILRGVNRNPGQDPEDMVSIRLWLDPARIISLSVREMAAVSELAGLILGEEPPMRVGEFLVSLIEMIGDEIDAALRELDDEATVLEDETFERPLKAFRNRLGEARRRTVHFRRHISSQRDALASLLRVDVDWIERRDRGRLHEAHDRAVRVVEELDMIRDRLQVLKDDLSGALSERLNRNLYLLSIISVIFLPLSVLTGLMGVNLAGMPGANWDPAFWTFASLLLVVAVLQALLLRILRLL